MDGLNPFTFLSFFLCENFDRTDEGLEEIPLVSIVHHIVDFFKVFQELIDASFRILQGLSIFHLFAEIFNPFLCVGNIFNDLE